MADTIKIIKDDHREVESLFKKYKNLEDGDLESKQDTAMEIVSLLKLHAEMEEKFFYPKLKEKFDEEGSKNVEEAYEEHNIAKDIITEIESLSPEDPQFDAKVTVLEENISHHVKEEEGTLLPKAKKELSKEELEAAGEEMEKFKHEFKLVM